MMRGRDIARFTLPRRAPLADYERAAGRRRAGRDDRPSPGTEVARQVVDDCCGIAGLDLRTLGNHILDDFAPLVARAVLMCYNVEAVAAAAVLSHDRRQVAFCVGGGAEEDENFSHKPYQFVSEPSGRLSMGVRT